MFGDKRRQNGSYVTELVETYEVFHCPERSLTHESRYLDYVMNGLDHRGPMTRNCSADPGNGMWLEIEGVFKVDNWKTPSAVIYIMDAATEKETDDFTVARLLHIPTTLDVWHAGQLPAYPEDQIGQRSRPRAALKMHLNRGSNAVFADGHVASVRPPARPAVRDPGNWIGQWYMKKFGVVDASTENPVIKAVAGASYPSDWDSPHSWYYRCSTGDPFYRP